MTPILAFVSVLAAAPTPAARSAGDLVYAPQAGARVSKSFTVEHALALQSLKLDDAGVGQVSQQQMDLVSAQVLRVEDEIRSVAGGRPLSLRRSFAEGSLHVDLSLADPRGESRPDAWDAQSPLAGASVLFTWVPEEKAYGRHYDAKEGLEEYLERMEEDLDLRVLLPRDPSAKPGDTWTIEPSSLATVFSPGGKVPLGFTQGGGGFFARTLASGVGGELCEVFGGEASGRAEARYVSRREEGGKTLALVALDLEIATVRDQTAFIRGTLTPEERLDGKSVERATLRWKFKGTGELLWNVSAGRFESLVLAGREEVLSEHEMKRSGQASAGKQSVGMAGSLKITAQASAPAK